MDEHPSGLTLSVLFWTNGFPENSRMFWNSLEPSAANVARRDILFSLQCLVNAGSRTGNRHGELKALIHKVAPKLSSVGHG